jgi:acyl-CoA hydrolase
VSRGGRGGESAHASELAPSIDLRGLIRPGDTVLWGQGPAEPRALTQALYDQQEELGPLTGVVGTILSDLGRDQLRTIRLKGFIGMGPAGRLLATGELDIVPCTVSDIPRLIERRLLAIDVALVQVSLPDARGQHSLGLAGDYLREAMEAARVTIAEVNPAVPFTLGDSLVDGSEFTAMVAGGHPPIEVPVRPHTPAQAALAVHAAGLIPDGAVIQIGIGETPDAILDALREKADLGVHSGMVTDRVAELMRAGVITNRQKPIDRGVTVTGTLFGTADGLYAFADRNPRIALRPVSYTHDFAVLRRIPRFTAINSAVEVDLTGQINTELVDRRYVGAIGGQLDFARGALAAPGGRSLVALASTAGAGERSRIVERLGGGVVTTPRSCADAVITEFGVAELRGRTLRERALGLAAIAHPAHRARLAAAARAMPG